MKTKLLTFLILLNFTTLTLKADVRNIDIKEAYQYLTSEEISKIENGAGQSVLGTFELNNDFKKLKEVIPHILNMRKSGIALTDIFISNKENKKAIQDKELRILKSHLSQRLETRGLLEDIIEKYYPYLVSESLEETDKITAILMMLSSTLIILDDYQGLINILELEKEVYKSIGKTRPKNDLKIEELRRKIENYKRKDFVFKKIHSIRYYIRHQEEIIIDHFSHPTINFLNKLITSSSSYKTYIEETRGSVFDKIIKFFTLEYLFETNFFGLLDKEDFDKITFLFSRLFADITGDIEWRKGKLFGNKSAFEKVKMSLSPMDILMEKAPFRLTDTFIPGYWGHNAIWIGNKEQLTKLGIWNHPSVIKYHKDILAGRSILEAVRPKVVLNDIPTFLNLDDIAIVEKNEMTSIEKANRIVKALENLDKGYDFNFDLNTSNYIFCSELIYNLFDRTSWQTQYVFGRNTISPDDVSMILFDSTEYNIKLFYNKGIHIPKNKSLKLLKSLVLGAK